MRDSARTTARSCARDLLRGPLARATWRELTEGQGADHVVDLGIGGPSAYYAADDHDMIASPHGAALLELAGGYYYDHPVLVEATDWPMHLRRHGCEIEADPFPLQVPCLTRPAEWSPGAVRLHQVLLLVRSLRRHYWQVGAGEPGAADADRDSFIDFAAIGVRLELDAPPGEVPSGFRAWVLELLA